MTYSLVSSAEGVIDAVISWDGKRPPQLVHSLFPVHTLEAIQGRPRKDPFFLHPGEQTRRTTSGGGWDEEEDGDGGGELALLRDTIPKSTRSLPDVIAAFSVGWGRSLENCEEMEGRLRTPACFWERRRTLPLEALVRPSFAESFPGDRSVSCSDGDHPVTEANPNRLPLPRPTYDRRG